jgi:DNA-binding CsgD family transcriptional regulator
LLLAAHGDLDAALAELERSLAEHGPLPLPLERARTVLALGRTQRRAKQKRAARESLEQASQIFDELGARLWVERAREELARIGGRAPSSGELTATERRVAELVAEGRPNKEVAAALFVTVKAVEANLSRVYAKLGIRSRAELASRLARAGKL